MSVASGLILKQVEVSSALEQICSAFTLPLFKHRSTAFNTVLSTLGNLNQVSRLVHANSEGFRYGARRITRSMHGEGAIACAVI